jgi:transcriptional regulator with XRE-family HTH domain
MSLSLGTFIRERRQELGLTQEQLAERIGDTVRQAEVSRLEHNRIVLPRRDRLSALAAALEVSLGELLVRTGWMQESDAQVLTVLEPPCPKDGIVDLERLTATDAVALVEALAATEAKVAATAEALEQAQAALASVRKLLQEVHHPRGEVHPRIGILDRWETAAISYSV